MRAFAHLPSKRRVAGVIAFALMVLSVLSAVHHHSLTVVPETAAFTTAAAESESARTNDCFVCRNLVSARELVPQFDAPQVVVIACEAAPAAPPALADTFAPASPRAPPAA